MLNDLWQRLYDFYHAHPVVWWATSIPLGFYATRSWTRIDVRIRRLAGWPEPNDPLQPPPHWQGTEIVRVWTLPALRRARVVAPGTVLAIVDRGVVQFELAAGSPLPGRLDGLAKKHALSPSAQAIQFPVARVDVSQAIVGLQAKNGEVVDAIVKLHVGVDPASPQRLVQSAPLRDGVISVAEVQALVEDVARPWLQARAGQVDLGVVTNATASLANELQAHLLEHFFTAHGLVGGVRSLSFQQPLAPVPA